MPKNISQLIKSYRKSNKLSTKALSDKINKSCGLISNLETGKSDVFNIDLLSTLMKELDIPLDEVISSLILDLSPNTILVEEVTSKKILTLIDFELRHILANSKNKEQTAELFITYIQNQFNIIKKLRNIS